MFFMSTWDDFIVCYIDDILIFSKNMEVHEHHVHMVLEKLQEVRLYVKLEKWEFHQSSFMSYLEMAFAWIFIKFRPLLIGLF